MSQFNFITSPQIQYPLRLNQELHQRFSNTSSRTKIPMSILGRIGILKLLNDIDERGITTVLNELEQL